MLRVQKRVLDWIENWFYKIMILTIKVFQNNGFTTIHWTDDTSIDRTENTFLQSKHFYNCQFDTYTRSTVSVFSGFNILLFQTCPSVA